MVVRCAFPKRTKSKVPPYMLPKLLLMALQMDIYMDLQLDLLQFCLDLDLRAMAPATLASAFAVG